MHKSKYKDFLMENFSDFLAFNLFIYDISQCKYGKQYSHKRLKKDWTVICNNSFFIKPLLVHGYITFEGLYNHQGKMHPDDSYTIGCNNDKTYIVDYWLKEKIQNSIIKFLKYNYTLDFSNKRGHDFLRPDTNLDQIKIIESLQRTDRTSLSLD